MAYEMHSMLTDAVSLMTWEKVMPAYGGENKAFLNNVVCPIYNVIAKVLWLEIFLFSILSTLNLITYNSMDFRKLRKAKMEPLIILNGETMMTWTSFSG